MASSTEAFIIKDIEVENNEMITLIRLAGGGLMAVDTSYLANDIGRVHSPFSPNEIVTGEGLTFDDDSACIFTDLNDADIVRIEGRIIDHKIIKSSKGTENYFTSSDLDISEHNLSCASKEGTTWTINDDEHNEIYLECIKYQAF